MKKLLITGSCGFLFSNFIRKVIYNKLDYAIFSIDSISNNILNNIYQNKNHSFYIGNCDNTHLLNIIMLSDKPDIIIHGAFDSTISKNIEITSKLLECAKNNKVERFVYMSSDEVYGSKDILFEENFKDINPVTEIGLCKFLCENFVKEYCIRNNINYTIVRVGQFFGPRQNKEEFLVKNFKKLNSNELTLNTNNIYSYGYVTDAVNGLLKILELNELNKIYNLSGDINISQKEILEELALVLGKKIEIKDNSINNFKFKINSLNLKNAGWFPEFDLKNSLELFSQWYLNNNWWFK